MDTHPVFIVRDDHTPVEDAVVRSDPVVEEIVSVGLEILPVAVKFFGDAKIVRRLVGNG